MELWSWLTDDQQKPFDSFTIDDLVSYGWNQKFTTREQIYTFLMNLEVPDRCFDTWCIQAKDHHRFPEFVDAVVKEWGSGYISANDMRNFGAIDPLEDVTDVVAFMLTGTVRDVVNKSPDFLGDLQSQLRHDQSANPSDTRLDEIILS